MAYDHSEKFDVFVSFSRDMMDWASAVEEEIERFAGDRGVRLWVRNYRAIDPATVSSANTWQDLVGSPLELGVKLCFVLFGERVGTPTPPEFERRHAIVDRLNAAGMKWIDVAGTENTSPDSGVPLTGLLFEMLDAILPPLEDAKSPDVRVILRGPPPYGLAVPDFGGGRLDAEIGRIKDPAVRRKARREYDQQLEWLTRLYGRLWAGGQWPVTWIADDDAFRSFVRRAIERTFGGLTIRTRDQDLPGLLPYGVEHTRIFFGRTEEKRVLNEAVFHADARRHFVRLEGESGAGKSSLLRAALLAEARRRFFVDQGWRSAFISLAEIRREETPLMALASALADKAAIPELGNVDILRQRMEVDPLVAAARLTEAVVVALEEVPRVPQPKLLIVVDQLEVALDRIRVGNEATRMDAKAFLTLLASLGNAAGLEVDISSLKASLQRLEALLPIRIAAALSTERVPECDAYVNVGMHGRFLAPAALNGSALRAIIEGTFRTLGIAISEEGFAALLHEALDVSRDAPVLPLLSTALRSLQEAWRAKGRPNLGLNRTDVDEYGQIGRAIARLGDLAWAELHTEFDRQHTRLDTEPPHRERVEPQHPLPRAIEVPTSYAPEAMRPFDQTNALTQLRFSDNSLPPFGPEQGLEQLLPKLMRLDSPEAKSMVSLRDVGLSELRPGARLVAKALLKYRLLWQPQTGFVRPVHASIFSTWKPAADWLGKERQYLALISRLEGDAVRREGYLARGNKASADAQLQFGEDWPAVLGLWRLRASELSAAALKLIEDGIENRIQAGGHESFRDTVLWLSAEVGAERLFKRLLALGAPGDLTHDAVATYLDALPGLNPTVQEGVQLLHLATHFGHESIMRALLNSGIIADISDACGWTPLHVAARHGQEAICRLLIDHGADIRNLSDDGHSALGHAVHGGNVQLIADLMDRGAPHEMPNANERALLACAVQDGHSEVVQFLLERGADVNAPRADGTTALHVAAHFGHLHVLRTLIERGAEVSAKAIGDATPLHVAAENGHTDAVNLLINAGSDVDAVTGEGRTPLHLAAGNGHEAVVRLLLERGAECNKASNDGHTVLGEAAHGGKAGMLRALVAHGASLQARTKEEGHAPLHCAAQAGNLEGVRFLIEHGANFRLTNADGHSVLGLAVHSGNAEVVRELVGQGAKLDDRTFAGKTLLHCAAEEGAVDVMRFLLERGVSKDARTPGHATPLHGAARCGREAAVRLLIDHGASVEAKTKERATPLFCAAESGHEGIARTLIDNGAAVAARSSDRATPLHSAAQNGHDKVVRLLLERGAPVDARTRKLITPLHLAVYRGSTAVVQLLLDAGADPNTASTFDHTPLSLALGLEEAEIVRMLVANGGDQSQADGVIESLLDRFHSAGQISIARLGLSKAEVNAAVESAGSMIGRQFEATRVRTSLKEALVNRGAPSGEADRYARLWVSMVAAIARSPKKGFRFRPRPRSRGGDRNHQLSISTKKK